MARIVLGGFLVATVLLVSACGGGSDGNDVAPDGLGTGGDDAQLSSLAEGFKLGTELQRFRLRPQAFFGDAGVVCVSGSSSKDFQDNNANDTVDGGDVMLFSFSQCETPEGEIFDGSVRVVLGGEVLQLDTVQAVNSVEAELQNLAITANGSTVVGNGTLLQSYSFSSETGKATFSSSTLSGESVTFVSGDKQVTVRDYHLELATDSANGSSKFSIDSGVLVRTPESSHGFTLKTTEDFVTVSGGSYPGSGEMLLTGTESGSVILKVVGSLVRVSVDSDNDGVAEWTNDYTWQQLEAFVN